MGNHKSLYDKGGIEQSGGEKAYNVDVKTRFNNRHKYSFKMITRQRNKTPMATTKNTLNSETKNRK